MWQIPVETPENREILVQAYEIVEWMKALLKWAGVNTIVLGLSGGADSALVAALAKLGEIKTILMALPCSENPEETDSLKDARDIAEWLEMPLEVVNILPAFLVSRRPSRNPLTDANRQSRLRMVELYARANEVEGGALVAGTTNKSEAYIGYCTKGGDDRVDFEPIIHLFKSTDVYDMLRVLNAPTRVLTKAPSAGLMPGQTDEGEIGFSYTVIDATIKLIEAGRENEADPAALARVTSMHNVSEHKRHMPWSLQNRPIF